MVRRGQLSGVGSITEAGSLTSATQKEMVTETSVSCVSLTERDVSLGSTLS